MKKYIFYLLAWCCISTLSAQTLNQAKKLFENGAYEQAKTAFSKLIKRSPIKSFNCFGQFVFCFKLFRFLECSLTAFNGVYYVFLYFFNIFP